MSDVTRLLQSIDSGDPRASSELLPLVYDELRRLASIRMRSERRDHTLGATALVHEAFLRMAGDEATEWNSRRHFFAAAAEAMRRILVESARRKNTTKRGGGKERVEFSDEILEQIGLTIAARSDDVLRVDEALEELAKEDERSAEVVKLHYFVGMNMEEVARALAIGERTAHRDWAYAKGWLRDHLKSTDD